MIQMKTKTLLMVMALSSAAIFESCTDKPAQTIGFKLENMDQSVKPGTDFYRYACGGWMKNNPLKPEYARFGSFDIVEEENKDAEIFDLQGRRITEPGKGVYIKNGKKVIF